MRGARRARTDWGVNWIEIKDDTGNIVPQSFIVDYRSVREDIFRFLPFVTGVASLFPLIGTGGPPEPFPYSPSWFFAGLVATILLVLLRLSIDDYRVIDGKSREIWLHRRALFTVRLYPVVSFDDCARLSYVYRRYEDKYARGFCWKIRLHMKDGKVMDLTAVEREEHDCAGLPSSPPLDTKTTAEKIASIIDCRLDPVDPSGHVNDWL